MVAIGRALMSKPETVLLDEPSMGLAPQLVEEIFQIVKDLNEKEDVTFLFYLSFLIFNMFSGHWVIFPNYHLFSHSSCIFSCDIKMTCISC